jgi:tetratricopeptide (TPR) repeat protein
MAMRKDPARRYASVSLLSEDIRRHCDGLTVVARPDTLGYRTAKFVQRNKTAVGAAAIFLLALVAALIVISFEAQRANRRFEDVRRLANSILFEVEPQIASVSGTTQARAVLVRRATEYLDSLSQEAGNDRSLRRDLAAAYEKVGDAQGNPNEANLGNLKAALAAYGKALALREALAKTSPKDARGRHELAGTYEKIGTALWWNDQTDATLANYHAALALRRALIAEQPGSVDFRWGFASLEMNLADVATWNGDTAEALADLQQALPVLQGLAQEQPSNAGTQINLARCIERVGMAYSGAADYTAAVDWFRRAEAIVEPITRRDPENYPAQLQHFNDVFGECVAYKDQKAVDKALAIAPAMIGIIEDLVRKDPQNTSAMHSMANSYSCYGEAFLQAGRWREALDPLQKGLAIDVRLGEQSPENGEYVHSRGAFDMDMGEALLHLGRLDEAAADEQAAETLLETSAAKDPGNSVPRRELVKIFILQGEILEKRGQPTEARRAFEQGLAGLEALTARKIVNKDDPEDFALLRAKLANASAR